MNYLNKLIVAVFFVITGIFVFVINRPVYKEIKVYKVNATGIDYSIKERAFILYSRKINEWFLKEKGLKIDLNLKENELVLNIHCFDYLIKGNNFWQIVSKLIKDSMFSIYEFPEYEPINSGFLRDVKLSGYELSVKNIEEKVNISFENFKKTMNIYLSDDFGYSSDFYFLQEH